VRTVVLVGFSTTGKSTILQNVEKKHGESVEIVDTDNFGVAAHFDNYIFNIYVAKIAGRDRKEALKYIEEREREILDGFVESRKPRLIGAGPALPIRPQWNMFLTRVKPICVFLEKTPEHIFEGLMNRRKKHEKNRVLANSVAFGSWDEDVTTAFRDGKWEVVERDVAVNNIRRHLSQRRTAYESCATENYDSNRIKDDKTYRERFYTELDGYLGLKLSALTCE